MYGSINTKKSVVFNNQFIPKLGAHFKFESGGQFDRFFQSSEIEQEKGIRGRGAVGKSNVAIMVESTVLEDIETGEKSNQCRYF